MATSIIDEAVNLIQGDRQKDYGPPWENFQDIADVWTPYVMRALESHDILTPTDIANLMVLLKTIRQVRGYNRDSVLDIIGYAACSEVINDTKARAKHERNSQ